MHLQKQKILILIFISIVSQTYAQKENAISSGELWPDTDGNHIQAHGGGIIKLKNTYFWYGEERRKGVELDSLHRYVSCYSSRDLVNWKFLGDVLKLAKPDSVLENSKWVLERPKVYFNKKNNKYVMYMHLDGKVKGITGGYSYAKVGVAISDKPTGPFSFLHTFRPLGQESRDIGQFIDDDGSAYLIFESRPTKGFFIAKLSSDYLNIEKKVAFIQAPLEGGAIVHYKGLYYVIGSALTGWKPNPNKVATAPSLSGPWSEFVDIAPSATNTYNSQSTMLLKVEGSKVTTVIFMADRWNPSAQWDSRYLWMPVEIGKGKLWVSQPRPWTINVATGEYNFLHTDTAQKRSH